jgi:geranylgeranyl diphosphate synthase type 3
MDDVEDNSELRRGLPVANTVYGVPQTINTANYVYFLAVQELLKLETLGEGDDESGEDSKGKGKGKGKAAAIDLVAVVNGKSHTLHDGIGLICIDELLQLHRGQGLDLFWRDSLQCPTEEEYVEMVLGSE